MGFMDKFFEVEKDEKIKADELLDSIVTEPIEKEVLPDVVVSSTNTDLLIETVYKENNLGDKTKSIYKVQDFIATLPKEMPLDSKKVSVLGILNAVSISTSEVLADADLRISVLKGVKATVTDSNIIKVNEAELEISNLQEMITQLNKVIYDAKNETESVSITIETEQAKIEGLKKFLIEE